MSSMTDVIFLLLIFFMVTSTLIFPAAIEVDLPQSAEQTQKKPLTEVYIDSVSNYYIVADRNDSIADRAVPRQVSTEELMAALQQISAADTLRAIALYADQRVEYGQVVEVLDMAARNHLRMVLATRAKERPASAQAAPAANTTITSEP